MTRLPIFSTGQDVTNQTEAGEGEAEEEASEKTVTAVVDVFVSSE